MIYRLKQFLKKFELINNFYKLFCEHRKRLNVLYLQIYSIPYRRREIARIRSKVANDKLINVAFLVMDKSVWKTDLLYHAMQRDDKFSPTIYVVPRLNALDTEANMNGTYQFFNNKGYNVVFGDLEESDKKRDRLLDYDVIFIDNPHGLSLNKYTIRSLVKKLTCYVPYFEQIDKNYETHFNGYTENLVWKLFQIHDIHKSIARQYAFNKGANIDVVGYPATEPLFGKKLANKNVWKKPELTKIILAPHHSIANSTFMSNSTFLENADLFKSLAIKYKDVVNFAFKPHPLLKDKLIENKDWGKCKTEVYWRFWEEQENTQYENGEYIDLFLLSDAMIHDCSSFIIEYIYTSKPCLYLNPNIKYDLNEYGRIGFDAVDKMNKVEDLEEFINNVIKGNAKSIEKDVIDSITPNGSPTEKIMKTLNDLLAR